MYLGAFAELRRAITGSPQFAKLCFTTIHNIGDYESIRYIKNIFKKIAGTISPGLGRSGS